VNNTPAHTAATRGYGNIYTPHAGSMIIQVQRELGLANRTIVLSKRKVRLLRFFNSRIGRLLGVAIVVSWVVLAMQATRASYLSARLSRMQHTAQRLDSLETTLVRLQHRYNQLHAFVGAISTPAPSSAQSPAIAPTIPPATGQ
jgi:hypothetical protein